MADSFTDYAYLSREKISSWSLRSSHKSQGSYMPRDSKIEILNEMRHTSIASIASIAWSLPNNVDLCNRHNGNAVLSARCCASIGKQKKEGKSFSFPSCVLGLLRLFRCDADGIHRPKKCARLRESSSRRVEQRNLNNESEFLLHRLMTISPIVWLQPIFSSSNKALTAPFCILML